MSARLHTIITFLATLAWSGPTARADAFRFCDYELQGLFSRVSQDSAVELEMNLSPSVLKLLTTTDGTLGGLLVANENLPPALNRWLKKRLGPKVKPSAYRSLAWDSFDAEAQSHILAEITRDRNAWQDFTRDRRFFGLKIRDRIQIQTTESRALFGKTYPAGEIDLNLSEFFAQKIEYRSSNDLTEGLRGVELHLRARLPAGEMGRSAWDLQRTLKIPRTHLHVHIVDQAPKRLFAKDPLGTSIALADTYRGMNEFQEMQRAAHNLGGITANRVPRRIGGNIVPVLVFDSLTPARLRAASEYVTELARGNPARLGTRAKKAFTGMHDEFKYDEPGRVGFQVRDADPQFDPIRFEKTLNGFQQSIREDQLESQLPRIRKWARKMKLRSLEEVPDAIAASSHNQPWSILAKNAPSEIQDIVRELNRYKIATWLDKTREFKFIFKNWENDLLIFDRPDLLERTLKAQRQAALEMLEFVRENHLEFEAQPERFWLLGAQKSTLRRFFADSGLFEERAKSFGLKPEFKLIDEVE